jgi:3-dehydroquinate dehydratase/shikimate dehydrogenase
MTQIATEKVGLHPPSPAKICVPICQSELGALRTVECADLIELRLDCLARTPEDLTEVLQNISVPVILTFRPSEQGGHRQLSREERLNFWNNTAPRGEQIWWDVEGDLAHEISPDWARVIVSHHDFNGVPDDLDDIYNRLAATPARVIKIAVQAHDIVDCIPVFQLLNSHGREVIPIAMGNSGIATRVLGPSRGAFLTYGSLDDENATAPGQLTASNLRSLYHIDKIDHDTMVCGLIGLPVMHSVSPQIHNNWFATEGVNGVYLPFEVKDLEGFLRRMVHPRTRELNWNLRGLSVTAPHKQTVMDHLDWIDPTAKEIGAVNTIVIEADRLLGYNTDAAGFVEPLLRRFELLAGRRAAIIGAGGAARAVIWALRRQNANVTIFARNISKAESFGVTCQPLAAATFGDYDLVVNTTPLGSGVYIDQSPATAEQLNGARCVYDLIYNPVDTRFLLEARKAGCDTIGGLEMLVAQAKIQFELWTGRKLNTDFADECGSDPRHS